MTQFRSIRALAIAALVCCASTGLRAPTMLDLPRASQQASISQRIGLTEIAIRYSRPLVHGRQIWERLVPYGEVWRAGANENTTFSVGGDVTIEGKRLSRGMYGLHMIPTEGEGTVTISKKATAWGSFTYDAAEDALRVSVKSAPADFREEVTYEIGNVEADSKVVTMRWEKIRVQFKVGVNTDAVVAESLGRQLRGWSRCNWNGWEEAASYLLDHKQSADDALE